MSSVQTSAIFDGSSGLSRVITRSQFIRRLTALTFLVSATSMGLMSPARAHGSSPPKCCGPSNRCSSCSGEYCLGGCTQRTGQCGGGSWWECCHGTGPSATLYLCRDWWDTDSHACICAGGLGPC